MALVVADRVLETGTVSTGTGSVNLAGANNGYQSFVGAVGSGNTTYYAIYDASAYTWEVGIGTVTSGTPNTLSRTTVIASSNSGSLVSFSTSNTLSVFCTYPAEKAVYSNSTVLVAPSGALLPVGNGGTGLGTLTTNYIPYGNGTGAFNSSSQLQYNGTFLLVGAASALGSLTNPIAAFTGNPGTTNYVQGYIYNAQNGISSSADFVAYTSNSTDAHGWADMGFTSPTYADTTYTVTGPNEAYLFGSALNSSYTGNLVYATDSTGSANAHQWYVGGFTQAKGAWKMQLTSTGLQLATALGVAYGGTGVTTTPTNGQLLVGNGTNYTVATLGSGTGISTTTGAGTLTVNNTGVTSNVAGTGVSVSSATGAVTISIGQAVATSSNVQFNSLGVGTAGSGTTGEIRATNNITAYYSDGRLKTRISTIKDAVSKVKQLTGFLYTNNDVAKSFGYTSDEIQVGLDAGEVKRVQPEVVTPAPFDIGQREDGTEFSKSGENYMTVRYERLVPLLVEAIKEIDERLTAIEARGS
jgi:hypothetical protein